MRLIDKLDTLLPCCLVIFCTPAAAGAGVQQRLALEWREWMTAHLLKQYFADRSFYQLQAGAIVDNPDQRIASDVRLVPAPGWARLVKRCASFGL